MPKSRYDEAFDVFENEAGSARVEVFECIVE